MITTNSGIAATSMSGNSTNYAPLMSGAGTKIGTVIKMKFRCNVSTTTTALSVGFAAGGGTYTTATLGTVNSGATFTGEIIAIVNASGFITPNIITHITTSTGTVVSTIGASSASTGDFMGTSFYMVYPLIAGMTAGDVGIDYVSIEVLN
jgi:hypothetical protein